MNTNFELENLLTTGCDERIIFPSDCDYNNYYVNPMDYSGLINRGSCTCGSLNPETDSHLKNIQKSDLLTNFETIVRDHTQQLKEIFSFQGRADFEVFFAPSGSHLVYYQLLFSKLLYPGIDPVNFLTCPEELGSGTQIAAHGKHFSILNQFGDSIIKNSFISRNIKPKVIMLPARDKHGHINSNRTRLKELIKKYQNYPKIVSLVFGSKSGIEDNLYIIDEVQTSDILWTVDLCQFRNKKDLVNNLLAKGYILLITGSKFYGAPPFCGALLVPKNICDQLTKCDPAPAIDFKNIFSAYDIPDSLPEIRRQLRNHKNPGLHLRWECALYEMMEYDKIGEEQTYSAILRWNEFINTTLKKSDYFELMPDMELTNKSIISFRIKHNRHYYNNGELKSLFIKIVSKRHLELNGFDRIFIGQPVNYESGSFLRFAISSYDVRQYVKNKPNIFENDAKIIRIIENEVENA